MRTWLLTLLLFLAACSTGDEGSERVAEAPDATLEAGTASFTIDQQITGGSAGDQTISSEGALDFEGQRGRVTTTVPDTGEGAGGIEVETIFDGNLVFLRLPEDIAPTPWVVVDLDDPAGTPGLEELGQFSTDPSQSFTFLEGIEGEVELIGEEEVNGAPATHYRFTVDLEQAAEAASDEARAYVQQQIEVLGVTELPTDLWLDEANRIVRQFYVLDLGTVDAPGTAIDGEVATTIEYFDFGGDIEVSAPPADQVTDFAELLEQAS